jgi:hypothetical protein
MRDCFILSFGPFGTRSSGWQTVRLFSFLQLKSARAECDVTVKKIIAVAEIPVTDWRIDIFPSLFNFVPVVILVGASRWILDVSQASLVK